jgi:hypothetical protein
MVGFAEARFFDRPNRAATKVYALSRAIFSVLSRSFSGLLPTPHRLSPCGGSRRRDEKPRPLHVHRHSDELKVAVVAIQAEIANLRHPYQFFIVAFARSTPTRMRDAVLLTHTCQLTNGLLRLAL